jgi:Fic family protein
MIFVTPKLDEQSKEVLYNIGAMRKQLKYSTSTPRRWSGLLRRNTLARAIRGSNSIEGYKATVEDAIAIVEGEEPTEAEVETRQALVGYQHAMTYVLQLAKDPNFFYSEGYVRSLHFMMLQHDLGKNPGNWRPGSIFVRDEQQNEVVYEGPDRKFVEPYIQELMDSLNKDDSTPDLVKAAMAHLNLVMIHPFSDGNGRMARCLQTLVLAREGILEAEFCSVEEYLGKVQQDYYDILARVGKGSWHPENDARPWIKFMLRAHYTQAAVLVWRIDLLTRLWGEFGSQLEKLGLPDRMAQPLVDAAIGLRVRNASYRHLAEISDNLASRDFKILVENGFLKPTGVNRGRIYIAAKKVSEIWAKAYQPFKMDDPFNAKQPNLFGFEL